MKKTINILLVDDNELDVEKIQRSFKKLSIDNPIFVAGDGIEALEFLRGENGKSIPRPRIVLLDLNMPKMNGLECLQEIRKDGALKNTPVFVLTTSDDKKDVEAAHGLNAQGYIIKPIKKDQMMEALAVLKAYWSLVEHPENGLESD